MAATLPPGKRVSITWSSPFCVGADDADEPATNVKQLVSATH